MTRAGIAQCGPHAALVVGLMLTPRTAEEVYETVEQALALGLADHFEAEIVAPVFGSPRLALQHIADGGVGALEATFAKLERHGYADHLDHGDGHRLWWAVL